MNLPRLVALFLPLFAFSTGVHAETCANAEGSMYDVQKLKSSQITAAIISAFVSVSIVATSRWFFARTDKRMPILFLIQEKLLELQMIKSGRISHTAFHEIPVEAQKLQPYFDRLRMISFPNKKCKVQKAWERFRNLQEDKWKGYNPKHELSDGLTGKEFIKEIDIILDHITQ